MPLCLKRYDVPLLIVRLFSLRMCRFGNISTLGRKYDVTFVLSDLDILQERENKGDRRLLGWGL